MDPNRPVSVSIPPSKASPRTVPSIFPPRAGGYQVHDLQQLKPETFSCFLSDLDHVPQLYPVFPTPPAPTSSRPRLNGVETTPPSSSVESEEYEVEYLYLTKIIIRKKKPTSTQPNPKEICRKRKFHEDNAEMQRRGKKARVDL